MRKILSTIARLVLALATAPAPAFAQATIEKLYVLDCGQGRASDMSRWTPGLMSAWRSISPAIVI